MLLGLLAFAVAFYALLKGRELADRVRKLEGDRDELQRRVAVQQRDIERLRGAPGATAPLKDEASATATRPAISLPTAKDSGVPSAAASPAAPPAPRNPAPGTRPAPPPVAPSPPSSPSPSIDWESLLGVKGAAWVGGIALIISAILFARWTIEQGLLTQQLRFALMLLAGLGSLSAAEIGLRRGYERTANPLSGAGIAILYIAFFAGHARYELISLEVAFIGMVLVTISACLLAVRYDAFATAVLGLLGGFATPVALSTGEDRPVALFSYILLLNLGLLAVGARKRWPGLFELGFLGTLLIQIGWFGRFMSPENLLVALVSFAALGLLYLTLSLIGFGEDNARVLRTGALGGLTPFLFAVYIGGSPQYVDQWPLLFGMIALLDLGILIMAVLRGHAALLLSASVATSLTLVVWATKGLEAGSGASLPLATGATILITAIFGLAKRVAHRFGDPALAAGRAVEFAAMVSWSGLGIFGLFMLGHDRAIPATPFLALGAALVVLLLEQAGHTNRLPGALSIGAMAVAILGQLWFFRAVQGDTVALFLTVPVGLSLVLSWFATRMAGITRDAEAELAVRGAAWIAILGLFATLALSSLAESGWPLFAALAAQVVVITGSVLRSNWTIGLPALLVAMSLHLVVWQIAYLKPDQYGLAMAVSVLFYLYFLTLPMIVPFARWREAFLPWLTSALAGPVFFPALYNAYQRAFGEALIGLLPLALALVSLGAVRVVSHRFVEDPADPLANRLRLRYLALFTGVALWFIAVAVPLQLDRQWITLGWAIEAMALCWLFGHLPHRGLPAFAFVLYALVGVRLLLNPEILRYEERGLPLFNWLLYTYGIAIVCCLAGQSLLRRRASSDRLIHRLADLIALNGLLLGFWLVNLEILDYFSTGPYLTLTGQSGYAVKLALSAGWGLYAAVLLAAGVAKDLKPLRYLSLAFLLLTVAKVFLYDLSELGGIFRVFSFLGLAVGLILVSVFYQKFVFARRP